MSAGGASGRRANRCNPRACCPERVARACTRRDHGQLLRDTYDLEHLAEMAKAGVFAPPAVWARVTCSLGLDPTIMRVDLFCSLAMRFTLTWCWPGFGCFRRPESLGCARGVATVGDSFDTSGANFYKPGRTADVTKSADLPKYRPRRTPANTPKGTRDSPAARSPSSRRCRKRHHITVGRRKRDRSPSGPFLTRYPLETPCSPSG